MTGNYKPAGYSDLSPYLVVPDADRTLAFIRAVFEAEPLRQHRRDDGTTMHAEVRIGDTILMLGQMASGPEINLHVYTPDPQALCARAEAAGGTVLQPPQLQEDGDLRGGINDGCGTVWWFARAGRTLTPNEKRAPEGTRVA